MPIDTGDAERGAARASFAQKISSATRATTLIVALVGAGASVATWGGKAVFSVHDLQQSFAEFGQKLDSITSRIAKDEEDARRYDDYTDRRFDWLNGRVANLEQRQEMAPPPHRPYRTQPSPQQ